MSRNHLQRIPWYRWHPAKHRWISSETQPSPSTTEPLKQDDFMESGFHVNRAAISICTFNVLFDRPVRPNFMDPTFHAQERFHHALNALKNLNADIIGLQEVTPAFLRLLGRQSWIRSGQYQVSADPNPDDETAMDTEINKVIEPFGQIFVSRIPFVQLHYYQFGRRSIKRCVLADFRIYASCRDPTGHVDAQKSKTAASSGSTDGEERILTIANIHLTAGKDGHDTERDINMRRGQLRRIFSLLDEAESNSKLCIDISTLVTHCIHYPGQDKMVLGDFNFGDASDENENVDSDYLDCWKTARIANEPGYTADVRKNTLTKVLCPEEPPVRLDRILVKSDRLVPTRAHIVCNQSFPLEDSEEHSIQAYSSDHFGILTELEFES